MSTASSPVADPPPSPSTVELILGQIEQLPTLPAVAARLLQVTTSQRSSAADVAAIIETDQALTAKVLALVRRAAVGARQASTVERAIVLLGFEAIRNAVLAVQVYETFKSAEPQSGSALDRVEFWKHSLAVACAARLAAEQLQLGRLKDEAFVCGLLHDLGKVALDACLPKSYARVLRKTRASGGCLCDVEREVLGLDHTVAGRRLAVRWKLPQSIIECVWLHHQPPATLPASITAATLIGIVHLADQIAGHQRIGYAGFHPVEPLEAVARTVGLDSEALRRVLAALPEQMEQHCGLVGLAELTGSDLYAQALCEANAELGRVNAALAEANRRLLVRARCFDALGLFTQNLTLHDTVAAVCLATARCVRQVLDLETTVGFYVEPRSGLYHVGVCAAGAERVEVLPSPGNEAAQEPYAAEVSVVVGLAADNAAALPQPVIRHVQRELGVGAVRMWPITHAEQVIGGVLFRVGGERTEASACAAEEYAALSLAFGLAVAGAADRMRSDRLNEELAHAGRRLHDTRSELLRAQAVARIGELAAGAAHELNNPLAVISGRAQMLAQGLDDPQQHRAAEIIHQHAQRASDIVSELVHFAKPDPPKSVAIPLAAWLDRLREQWEARSSLRPGQLQVTLSDPGLRVLADPEQLRQIFDALLANALEATSPQEARLLINSASPASDDRIVVTVEDNGAGMALEVLEHAADPFFSHRTAGRGRGMGLSHATRLAANNGGRLWLASTPGVGTTAFLELPAARR